MPKVYIIFYDYRYEGLEVYKIFLDKTEAENYLNKHQSVRNNYTLVMREYETGENAENPYL